MQRQYNHERKAFLIKDGEEEVAAIPFPYSDTNRAGNVFDIGNAVNYRYSIYYKYNVAELDYHLVKVNTGVGGGRPKRLGWLIPLAALTTEDPDILAVPFLNEFAFWAYSYLLEQVDIQNGFNDEEATFSSILDAMYPDGCLLIVENVQIPVGKTEKHYELSLAKNGYFRVASNYLNPKILLARGSDLILTSAGEIIDDAQGSYSNQYIEEFITSHVYDNNSFIRFFFLYQIVEVLLDAEMVELLRDFANKIENNQTTYRTADKALQNNTESERFKRVVRHSGINTAAYTDLENACKGFTGLVDIVNPESIYQVRNHIVHRFRKAASDEASVKDICDYMELYMYDLLIAYKKPDVNAM